jgi:beta-glucanase (GH16 family)
MTFDDEFNTLSLWNGSSGTWDTTYLGEPLGINGFSSTANGEQEWYVNSNYAPTSSVTPWSVDSSGVLHIQAAPASSAISSLIDGYQYTSGRLSTWTSFSQTYGLFEARMKLPAGQGFWPAFWLKPLDGASGEEIDIMEALDANTSQVYTTVHSNVLSGGSEYKTDPVVDTTQWHTYAVDWEPNYITWYIDGNAVYKVATPADLDTPMYMILNLALGGTWGGAVAGATNLNNAMEVDWVRVYQSDATITAAGNVSTPGYDFTGSGISSFLIQNTNGAVDIGQVASGKAAYTQVTALGPQWTIASAGDFLGDGGCQFLMRAANGAIDVGEVQSGVAHFTQIGALAPQWTLVGSGDYLGDGKTDFLIESTSGTVDVGEVGTSGQAAYTPVSLVGSEWRFLGSGDFLAEGHDQFLIENTNGALDVGDVQNGEASYTQIGAIGPEWRFEETGDFLGDGRSDFLIENTNGSVVVGELGGGDQANWTAVAMLGPEWRFVGAGDFLAEGHDQFLIENTSGAIVVGDIQNGQARYTQVGAVGSAWSFHG